MVDGHWIYFKVIQDSLTIQVGKTQSLACNEAKNAVNRNIMHTRKLAFE